MTTAQKPAPTRADYDAAFEKERQNFYRDIDVLESRLGFVANRMKLEAAARVLACPVKANPANWQHGRVIYSVLRRYIADSGLNHDNPTPFFKCVDIGTAKGFSALCMVWALTDAAAKGKVTSIDVIDPAARVRRNTVAEVDGFKTLRETLEPWPEASAIDFVGLIGGADFLATSDDRVHFAFVDGKHTRQAVSREAALLKERQQRCDVIIFDDVQIPGVREAVDGIDPGAYSITTINAKYDRRYAVAYRL